MNNSFQFVSKSISNILKIISKQYLLLEIIPIYKKSKNVFKCNIMNDVF